MKDPAEDYHLAVAAMLRESHGRVSPRTIMLYSLPREEVIEWFLATSPYVHTVMVDIAPRCWHPFDEPYDSAIVEFGGS